MTFDRHPAQVIRPDSAPLLLTDLDQKLELLADTGIDYTLVVGFDQERATETAEHFVESVLVECLRARSVVVGEDFHFGHHRRGNVALLTEMGGRAGSRCSATSWSVRTGGPHATTPRCRPPPSDVRCTRDGWWTPT